MSSRIPSTPASAVASPEESPKDPDDLVTVAMFSSLVEANVAKGTLEAHGIEAFLKDQMVAGMASFLGHPVEGVRLVVRAREAGEARVLLSTPPDAEEEAGPAEEPDRPSTVDDLALRAWRAAVLGLVLPLVLHLYSIRLLIQFVTAEGRASPRARWRAVGALVIDAAVLAVTWMLVRKY